MKAILVGYGKMGQFIEKKLQETEGTECVGILHHGSESKGSGLEDLFCHLKSQGRDPDVVMDFSHPDNLDEILHCLQKNPKALVIGTTGYTEQQISRIHEAAKKIPVLHTANFSLGITIMKRVATEIATALGENFDIEIVEKHHRGKIDAPSGTAIMLAEAIDPEKRLKRVCGRKGHSPRGYEIGIHALRGGTIAGEHTILFAGEDETLEITHRADSRQIFVNGAVRGALFIAGQPPGLYTMAHVINGVC